MLGLLTAAAGCAGILGLDDYDEPVDTSSAAAGSGGEGGAGGDAGEGGVGGAGIESWCDTGTLLFSDDFTRGMALVDSWGTPNPGAAQGPPLYYVLLGGNQEFSVDGSGFGRIHTRFGKSAATVPIGAEPSLEIQAEVGLDKAPDMVSFQPFGSLALRHDGANSYYEARVMAVGGDIALRLVEVTNASGSGRGTVVIDAAAAAGQRYHLRLQVEGTGPVSLRAAAWRVGDPVPAEWALEVVADVVKTDTQAGAHGGASQSPTGDVVNALFDNMRMCRRSP